jgi:hypothetical protein
VIGRLAVRRAERFAHIPRQYALTSSSCECAFASFVDDRIRGRKLVELRSAQSAIGTPSFRKSDAAVTRANPFFLSTVIICTALMLAAARRAPARYVTEVPTVFNATDDLESSRCSRPIDFRLTFRIREVYIFACPARTCAASSSPCSRGTAR